MKLFNYFRSGAAYRVRIALNLKGLSWAHVGVHLVKREQRGAEYLALNPAGLVPSLALDDGHVLTQSMAIIEYLDEAFPQTPRLLPGDALARARIRAQAQAIACDVHPLNNARVLNYLSNELGVSVEQKDAWIAHWINLGFAAFERTLEQAGGDAPFCAGDAPTLADCVLVPQVFSARRFNVDLTPYPRIVAIDARCAALPAFAAAHPAQQPDFEG